MFKIAVAKLAHNSTIPALAGNSDLRPLQEVIATEKLVLHSYVYRSAPTILITISRFQSPEAQHRRWQVRQRSTDVGWR